MTPCHAEGLPNGSNATANASPPQKIGNAEIYSLPRPGPDVSEAWREIVQRKFLVGNTDRIIQVNAHYVKGRDSRFFKNVIASSEGAQLGVVVLSLASGDLTLKTVTRHSLEASSKKIYGTMLGASDIFEGPYRAHYSLPKLSAKYCHDGGADQYAAAIYRDLVNGQPYSRPAVYEDKFVEAFPEAVKFFDKTGYFAQSDWTIKKAIARLKNITQFPLSDSGFEAFLATAKYLRETDRAAQAATIEDALFPTTERLRDKQLGILKHFEPNWSGEAELDKRLALYDKFERICATTGSRNSDDLEFLASGYYECGKFAKAEPLFERLLVSREQDIPLVAANNLQGYETILRAYIGLSYCQLAAGKTEDALKHLNDALKLCSTKCNTEEIVRLERFATPCMSDIKIAIAKVHMKAGKRTEARKVIDDAIKQTEAALRSDSPQLKAPLLVRGELCRLSGDQRKASEFDRQAAMLSDPSQSYTVLDDFEKWKRAREVYDALQTKDFAKADSLIDKLIAQEKTNTKHIASDVCRLVNLAKVYSMQKQQKRAFDLLTELLALTDGWSLRPTRLYILGELALLSEDLDLDATKAWKGFDDHLKHMQDIAYANINGPQQSKTQLVRNLIQRVGCHAVVYVFNGEPEKGVRILERLLKECDDSGGVGNPEVLTQLAFAQLECGDIEASSKTVRHAIATGPVLYDTMQKFAQIADGFFLKKHGEEGSALLKELISKLKQSEHFKAAVTPVALERARIEISLGNLKEAHDTLKEADNKDWNMNHWRVVSEIGRVLELEEKYDEAIDVYFKAAAMNELRNAPRGFETVFRLFNLLRRQKDVPKERIEAAVDFANELYGTNNVEFWQETTSFAIEHYVYGERMMKPQLKTVQYEEEHNELYDAMCLMSAVANEAERIASPQESEHWHKLADLQVRNKEFEKASNTVLAHLCVSGHYVPQKRRLQVSALYAAGQFKTLERILRKNLEVQDLGPKEVSVEAKVLLASFLIRQGRYADAAPLEQDILSFYASTCEAESKLRGKRNWDQLSLAILEISDAYLERNDVSSAKKFTEQIYSMQNNCLGPKHPLRVGALELFARIYDAKNNQKARGRALREALEIARFNFGTRPIKTASIRIELADLLRRKGSDDEAEQIALNCVQYFSGPNIKLVYGPTAGDAGHGGRPSTFADTAEQPLKDAIKETDAAYGAGSSEAIAALDQVIKFYIDRKNTTAARDYEKLKAARLAAIGFKK